MSRIGKFHRESRLVIVRAGGRGEMGLTDNRFLSGGDGNHLELDSSDSCTTL